MNSNSVKYKNVAYVRSLYELVNIETTARKDLMRTKFDVSIEKFQVCIVFWGKLKMQTLFFWCISLYFLAFSLDVLTSNNITGQLTNLLRRWTDYSTLLSKIR